jgi:hypothetical protein
MHPTLLHFGVGAIPWSALARGYLTRPWRAGSDRESKDKLVAHLYSDDNVESEAIVGAVAKVAEARGVTMAQVALAWLLSKDAVAAPIVGTTSLKNLDDLVGACCLCSTEGCMLRRMCSRDAAEADRGGDQGSGGTVQADGGLRPLVNAATPPCIIVPEYISVHFIDDVILHAEAAEPRTFRLTVSTR